MQFFFLSFPLGGEHRCNCFRIQEHIYHNGTEPRMNGVTHDYFRNYYPLFMISGHAN